MSDSAATTQRLLTGSQMLRDRSASVAASLSQCQALANRLDNACKYVQPALAGGADARTVQLSLQNLLGGLADVVTLLQQHLSAAEQRVPKLASAVEELEVATNAPSADMTQSAAEVDSDMIFGTPSNMPPSHAHTQHPAQSNSSADPFSGLVPEMEGSSVDLHVAPTNPSPPVAVSSRASPQPVGAVSFSPSTSPSTFPAQSHRSPSPVHLGPNPNSLGSFVPVAGAAHLHAPVAPNPIPVSYPQVPVNSDVFDLGSLSHGLAATSSPPSRSPQPRVPIVTPSAPEPHVIEASAEEYNIDLTPAPAPAPAPHKPQTRAASRPPTERTASSASIALAEKYFGDLDEEQNGWVSGQKVRELWMKSNLPPQFLSEVWKECRSQCPTLPEGLDLPAFVHGFERIRVARTQQQADDEEAEEDEEEVEEEDQQQDNPQPRVSEQKTRPVAKGQPTSAVSSSRPVHRSSAHGGDDKSSSRALFSRLKDLKYSPIENKVREATSQSSNESVVTSPELVEEIALATKDPKSYAEAWEMLWKKLEDYQYHDHVAKALRLLDMLIRHPASNSRIVSDTIARKDRVAKLKRYKFYNANNEDVAVDVRQAAGALLDLLANEQALIRARGRKDW